MTAQGTIIHPIPEPQDERVGLDDIWRIIRRRLLLMTKITFAVFAIAFLYIASVEPEYQTRSTVVLTTLDTRVRAADVQVENFEITHAIVETELDILRSREFALAALEVLQPYDNPAFAGPADIERAETESERTDRLVDKMLASYSVYRDGNSLAVEIVGTSTDPVLAADIANTVAETYILQNRLQRRESIERSIAFLRDRVERLGEELSAAELDLAAFIRENELDDVNRPIQLRADMDRLTVILNSLDGSEADGSERTRIEADLERTEQALRERTRAELALLNRERAMELQRIRYQASIERLNDLETQIDFVTQGTRQVSVARVPIEPASPNKPVALAASGLAGVVLAFVAALALEGLNTRLWSDGQSRRASGLPNYSHIPRIGMRGILRRRFQPVRHLLAHPSSAFSESLRSLLTVWFNTSESSRIMAVTSGLPNEGKSTVAVSLATAAFQDGMRVLVVDLDQHRRGAARLLEKQLPARTLEAVLNEDAAPATVMTDAKSGSDPGGRLDFLPIKFRDKNTPSECNRQLAELRERFLEQYDLVLVDTPPVLVLDDACRLNALVDKTIIVVRWGHTSEEVLRETCERLKRNKVELAGTVINDVDLRKQRTHGYGGYAYGYSYGRSTYA